LRAQFEARSWRKTSTSAPWGAAPVRTLYIVEPERRLAGPAGHAFGPQPGQNFLIFLPFSVWHGIHARLYTAPTPNAGELLAVGVVSDGRWSFAFSGGALWHCDWRKGNVGGGSASHASKTCLRS